MASKKREAALASIKKDMIKYFNKSDGSYSERKPSPASIMPERNEKLARNKIKERLLSEEITPGFAKKLLEKITNKFEPYNNENERINY